MGLVNHSTKSFIGWQDGWVNVREGYFKGLESGLMNIAKDTHGLQFGLSITPKSSTASRSDSST